jgi:hypothetical protein
MKSAKRRTKPVKGKDTTWLRVLNGIVERAQNAVGIQFFICKRWKLGPAAAHSGP